MFCPRYHKKIPITGKCIVGWWEKRRHLIEQALYPILLAKTVSAKKKKKNVAPVVSLDIPLLSMRLGRRSMRTKSLSTGNVSYFSSLTHENSLFWCVSVVGRGSRKIAFHLFFFCFFLGYWMSAQNYSRERLTFI